MSTKTKTVERNGTTTSELKSVFNRAITANSEWPDKDEFLDVIYWARQAIGIILGVCWGLIPLKGFLGLLLLVTLENSRQ
jgi:hypothetical protein